MIGEFFLYDYKKNDKMVVDGKKFKNNFCSFIFINEFVKIRYGLIFCYFVIIIVLLFEQCVFEIQKQLSKIKVNIKFKVVSVFVLIVKGFYYRFVNFVLGV